jgi:glutamate-1-semialdehyde 2,1-aminomutase
MCLGGTIQAESAHAALICQRFGLQRVRFANSGTEANLYALLAARGFTGRRKIVIFNAAYHGGVLFGYPDGAMSPNTVDRESLVILGYNDIENVKQFFATPEAEEIAAVLVEPMQGGGGGIRGHPEFLLCVQQCARAAGALLVIDEVMTSRLAPGGLQSTITGLKPDLTSFGKYLGGGFAFGAFGGREDVMGVYDPRRVGSLAHLGTFNQNSMAMNVGYIGLKEIFTPEVCIQLGEQGDNFRDRLNYITKGTKLGFTGVGSILVLHVTKEGIRGSELKNAADAEELTDIKDLFWFEMLEEGFWIHRRGSINLMLGTPQKELNRFVDAVEGFLKRHENIVRL